jgi:hypothetical protein
MREAQNTRADNGYIVGFGLDPCLENRRNPSACAASAKEGLSWAVHFMALSQNHHSRASLERRL